jgi:hypothetical protein
VSVSVCLAAKCITAVTFGLLEALINLSLVGFPKLGFSLAGCQNLGVHMCFVTVVHCYFPMQYSLSNVCFCL